MVKFSDINAKSDDQLAQDLLDLKKEQMGLRFQSATSQLDKPSRIRHVRRQIAQIKTAQNMRQKNKTEKQD